MADNTNRIAGTANLTVDGKSYMVAGDFEYNPSKVTRQTLSGQDGVHGYSETPRPGSISATLRDAGGLTVADLNDMTNVTVVTELANGKTVIGSSMWTIEDQTAKSTDATIEVKWEGQRVTEN
ncbi:phage tail tube protein [Cupriavidus basilensis]|uniref:Phage tail tube protein n=1 Tax=Cupriavidus basilensis TaxID=68895 RepID=A0A643G4G3_9BURK|nr:phage tail tube protein [Cupriavidus basilensis]QOT75055.1 phage tail tube protein [Cupriavidus basilensis]